MSDEVYLDYAATAPIRGEVIDAVASSMRDHGNASSLHGSGRRARRRVEEAREQIAAAVGADPVEVVFTAGGTEADNLAVKGIHWSRTAAEPARTTVVTSPAEHHAVLDAVRWLATGGARIAWAEPDPDGVVAPAAVADAIDGALSPVSLVSVMWANNEVGAVSPIQQIAAVAAEHGVPLHTDAVQAVGTLPVDFGPCGADALSLSAHKFGGPQGVGALLVRRAVKATPVLHGGGQERDLRSGTVDIAGVVGMAVALDLAVRDQEAEFARLTAMRTDLLGRLRSDVPDLQVNGNGGLPGLLSLSVPGCAGDALLMVLDERGLRVSTGAACTSGVPEPSHVVLAMTGDPSRAGSTLRLSFGRLTTAGDLDAVVAAFPTAVRRARAAAG